VKRACLDCGRLFTGSGSRCREHAIAFDRARQARRGDRYAGDWSATSRAQREAVPYCESCGATDDLTADHYRGGTRTLCRRCNRPDAIRDRQLARAV